MKCQKLCVSILIIFGVTCLASADRGDDILPLIQSGALEAHIAALQENVKQGPSRFAYRTRSVYNREASDNAAEHIATQFRRSSRLNVEFEEFSGMKNVIAKLPPRLGSPSDRIFIVCAHYDSKSDRDRDWNPLISEAPGADDNATGVAAMLEIAHVLSQFDYEHELRFVAFTGKELGLLGSRHHARKASRAGEYVVAVFNIDMIGFNWENDLVVVVQDGSSRWMNDAFLLANRWYDLDLEIRGAQDELIDSGDHKSFWENDYRAVTLTESGNPRSDSKDYRANPFHHTRNDTVDRVNVGLVRKITQLMLVTLNNLASLSADSDTAMPRVTIDPQPLVRENPTQITGQFETSFPVYIIVHPGNITAQVDRVNSTYQATVPLNIGTNQIRVVALHALGARSVEQTIVFEPNFAWESAIVFPNPLRDANELTVFRAEANLPIEQLDVFIYSSDGTMVKRSPGVVDPAESRIWRTWWNQKTNLGLQVAPGIYVCRFEILVKGKKYSRHRKLAILR